MRAARWRVSPSCTLGPGAGGDAWPILMAIVNVTPDSFSDGGDFASADAAARHASECIAEGARIIDVGGESTRPGAAAVDPAEQVRRTVPAIEAIMRAHPGCIVSIDTTSAHVAERALLAGASIVNDVSGGTDDPRMLPLCARQGCGVVLMHRLRRPSEDSYSDRYGQPPAYADVVRDVREALVARAAAAMAAGVDRESVAIDPGLGFGKGVDDNWRLVERMAEIADAGFPVLAGASRKSFVGARAGIPDPRARDAASVDAALACARGGAAVLRVHAVGMHQIALERWRCGGTVPASCQGA